MHHPPRSPHSRILTCGAVIPITTLDGAETRGGLVRLSIEVSHGAQCLDGDAYICIIRVHIGRRGGRGRVSKGRGGLPTGCASTSNAVTIAVEFGGGRCGCLAGWFAAELARLCPTSCGCGCCCGCFIVKVVWRSVAAHHGPRIRRCAGRGRGGSGMIMRRNAIHGIGERGVATRRP